MGLPTISLYTGAGGLDLGLEAAGFKTKVCVEVDQDCCATLRKNRPKWKVINQDIGNVSTKEILKKGGLKKGEAALLLGGPPCQPFSKSRNWRNPHGGPRGLKDPRAETLKHYLRVLEEARPQAFVMENVHGLAYSVNGKALSHVLKGIPKEYNFAYAVLNAAAFGLPQIRERLFIVGWRTKNDFEFPSPTHAPPEKAKKLGLLPYRTAGQAIGDLDRDGDVPTDDELIGELYRDLLPEIPEGNNYLFFTKERGYPQPRFRWRTKYWSFLLKLSQKKPSWTIQAQQGPYTGPFHWRNRKLRVAELKRLQTFPDDYVFEGAQTAVLRQIGNAVPCELGAVLARAIREQFFRGRKARALVSAARK